MNPDWACAKRTPLPVVRGSGLEHGPCYSLPALHFCQRRKPGSDNDFDHSDLHFYPGSLSSGLIVVPVTAGLGCGLFSLKGIAFIFTAFLSVPNSPVLPFLQFSGI